MPRLALRGTGIQSSVKRLQLDHLRNEYDFIFFFSYKFSLIIDHYNDRDLSIDRHEEEIDGR